MSNVTSNQFHSQPSRDRNSIVPSCGSCGGSSDSVELVDATLTNSGFSTNGGISPVWHCNSCGSLFQGRTYETESVLSNNGYNNRYVSDDSSNSSAPTKLDLYSYCMNNGNTLQQAIQQEALTAIRNEWGYELERSEELITMKETIEELKAKLELLVKADNERKVDPLFDLRERVAKFRMKAV